MPLLRRRTRRLLLLDVGSKHGLLIGLRLLEGLGRLRVTGARVLHVLLS